MKRAGIVGHPVAHSLSPVFQRAAFRALGLDIEYELWDTPPEALASRINGLRDVGCLGANVTIPHKEAVLSLLDECPDEVSRIGAVNTIVNRGGRLSGHNTDGPGFVAALRNEIGFDPAGKSFLLLGAGGAARGIAFALAAERASRVAILNRSTARAERLAREVAEAGGNVHVLGPEEPLSDFACVVNCTSVGMHGGPDPEGVPVDVAGLSDGALAVDIVYAPEETPFLRAASGRGLETFPGLPMLIYQGALAFELWTGLTAPVEVMFQAARSELLLRAVPT